ncbi:ATP-binding cassette domain-containing protein [bacterium]|nr:ATP-binding cassette domain-containing protein [bacterium]
MRTVDLDTSFLNSYPNQLSYVAQKKVSIARTLAVSPDYLLFDEPTTGMDPVATAVLNELLKKLKRELNVTTIVVSHDIKSALACADRLILIDHGKIVFDGEPKNFKSSNVPLAIDFREGVSLGK